MPSNYAAFFKKLWHDPVWSKVIAGIFLALGALITAFFSERWLMSPQATPTEAPRLPIATSSSQKFPPITIESLKNLTYQIDGDRITLNDGKRKFNPDTSPGTGLHEKAIAVFLTEHAFGDLGVAQK